MSSLWSLRQEIKRGVIWNVFFLTCRYSYEYLQIDRELANLHFLKKCKQSTGVPKFLESLNRLVNSLFPSLKMHIGKKCLQAYIKIKYRTIDHISSKYLEIIASLSNSMVMVTLMIFSMFRISLGLFRDIIRKGLFTINLID